MYKNLAATPVAACFVAPVSPQPAAGTHTLGMSLLPGIQGGLTP
jgi:hypothetical protein